MHRGRRRPERCRRFPSAPSHRHHLADNQRFPASGVVALRLFQRNATPGDAHPAATPTGHATLSRVETAIARRTRPPYQALGVSYRILSDSDAGRRRACSIVQQSDPRAHSAITAVSNSTFTETRIKGEAGFHGEERFMVRRLNIIHCRYLVHFDSSKILT